MCNKAVTSPTAQLFTCSPTVAQICQNGGRCVFDDRAVYCQCEPTFSGTFCTQRVNFCSTNPCRNGGVCNQNQNDFNGSCTCRQGFTGDLCDVSLTCNPNPCKNNQQCLTIDNLPVCLCSQNFTGPTCDIRLA